MMFYKEDEEAYYLPQMNRPDYKRGFYYCSRCGISLSIRKYANTAELRQGRRGKRGKITGEKPRVNLDYGYGE